MSDADRLRNCAARLFVLASRGTRRRLPGYGIVVRSPGAVAPSVAIKTRRFAWIRRDQAASAAPGQHAKWDCLPGGLTPSADAFGKSRCCRGFASIQLHWARAALDPQIMFLNIFFVHHIDRAGARKCDHRFHRRYRKIEPGGAASRPELVF
jgi:hypothetical protein